jgi:hypothetical protein
MTFVTNSDYFPRQLKLIDFGQGESLCRLIDKQLTLQPDGFGGLVVSMLASGSRVRGFDPDQSRCEKILSMPSFVGEVK